MASEYIGISGFIQFDPRERKVGERTVRDIVIRQTGSAGMNVSVTLWPDFKDVAVKKGDFVAVEGKHSTNKQGDVTYHNLSAQRILVQESVEAPKPGTTNTESSDDDSDDAPF